MKMQVAWFHRFAEPEELVLEETECPTPGPGEALVGVRAVGVNHVDLDVRAGTARIPMQFPHILGREFAGSNGLVVFLSTFSEPSAAFTVQRSMSGYLG